MTLICNMNTNIFDMNSVVFKFIGFSNREIMNINNGKQLLSMMTSSHKT